jgi:hypothetical protein
MVSAVPRRKLGIDKKQAMRVATQAAKLYLQRQGIVGKPGPAWRHALRVVLPVFWSIVRETGRIPTPEEVVARVEALGVRAVTA